MTILALVCGNRPTVRTPNPDIATVLTGTNDLEHLESNVQAVMDAPLSPAQIEGLDRLLNQD